MRNKEEILNRLFALHRFGIKPGLERTLKLLDYIGNPHLKYPAIHVAGTNGKGSVCAMIASILIEAGYKVGLYTSPHLVRFNERIRINLNEITDDEMVESAEKLLKASEKWECTFFEITTAMAFGHFANKNIDIAVIETGMGGRFDSTNVLNPLVSIITNIDLDHKEYLGNSFEEIAFEKAGIIKKNVPVVISDNNYSIKHVFNEIAGERESELIYCADYCKSDKNKYHADFSQSVSITTANNYYENIRLNLPGSHQIQNLFGAITAIELIQNKFNISENDIQRGLTNININTGIRGRIELLNNVIPSEAKNPEENGKRKTHNSPIILDTGHNPGAMFRLIETLKLHRPDIEKWNFVYGGMADKDIEQILRILLSVCNELILTQPNIERAMNIEKLSEISNGLGFKKISAFQKVQEAVDYAINSEIATVITGSFYLAGEALPILENMFKV